MRQRGYNLVMLIMAITVLNIMVAVSLPMWSEVIQRDREEELISRGFQYAEAIRVFFARFQRQPVRLEELVEVKPRCIRRLWKDPITDGRFVPIHPDQPQPGGGMQPQPQGQDGEQPQPDPGQENPEGPDPGSFNPGSTPKGPVSVGPIIGVRSSSTKKSFLVFTGKEHYNEWRFTVEFLMQGRPSNDGTSQQPPQGIQQPVLAPGAGMNLSVRWLGRPLPAFLQPPQGSLPGDQQPKPGSGLNPGGGKDPAPNPAGKLPRGRNG
jgi:type II secretory pathway pseudopilin PulG